MDETLPERQQIAFTGKILIIGFGSIGQGVLPLLLRHFTVSPDRITIVTGDSRGEDVAQKYLVNFKVEPLTPDNYERIIRSHIGAGDFLLNVSVDVSSAALIELCQREGILYLDTDIGVWFETDIYAQSTLSERSNYALREEVLSLRHYPISGSRTTAVLTHGANPGLVSHFVKQALLNIARDTGVPVAPTSRDEWAHLAMELGVKVIHIAERDTQVSRIPKMPDEFVNTWSIDGLVIESCQPTEMGWGTHEKRLPKGGHKHSFGCKSAIYLDQPGYATKVQSWTPIGGGQVGWVITHNEAMSIADYLTVRDGGTVVYRPTVHYAYHPCDAATLSLEEFIANKAVLQKRQRLISGDILPGGVDELGVLLMGHAKNGYWFGSRLSIDEARERAPHNGATTLQVTAGVMGAMAWAVRNPHAGIVDADEIDYAFVLDIARPYLGRIFGEYTDWRPMPLERSTDPDMSWQFEHFKIPAVAPRLARARRPARRTLANKV